MAKYLVTGGAGFIGSHLVDALIKQNHEVTVLDNLRTGHRHNINHKAKFMEGDIRDKNIVQQCMAGKDGCFHLAAVASVQESVELWAETHEVNITGAINIFDAARREPTPLPVVYASSAAVYGDNQSIPLSESESAAPLSAYGADKYACEVHAKVGGHLHALPTAGFRFFNVYGPRQDPSSPYSGVISIFCDRIRHRQDLTIFGDGQQTRDFIYVEDIVKHLIAGMNNADCNAQVYNACTGKQTSLLDLARTLFEIFDTEVSINHASARDGDIVKSAGNPERAITHLGVISETKLAEGLAVTVESINEQISFKVAS